MIEADKSGAFFEKKNRNEGKDDQCYRGGAAEETFDNGVGVFTEDDGSPLAEGRDISSRFDGFGLSHFCGDFSMLGRMANAFAEKDLVGS